MAYTKGEHGYFTGSISEGGKATQKGARKSAKREKLVGIHMLGFTKEQAKKEFGDLWAKDRPTPKSFWDYQAATETPTLQDAVLRGAISSKTTESQWAKLSPGMRREIVRSRKR